MRIINFIPLCFLLITSCNLREVNFTEDELLDRKTKVIIEKDQESLNDLILYLGKKDSISDVEALPYIVSTFGSNEYNYYSFVFYYLKARFHNKFDVVYIDSLSAEEQIFLVSLLERGSKTDSNCRDFLFQMYDRGIYFKQDKFKADSLYEATYHQPRP